MQIKPETMAVFTDRARGRFADETVETWRVLAPRVWPKVPSTAPEAELRSWAAEVFDRCNAHQIRERALGVRLTLGTFRAINLGLGEAYVHSVIDYFLGCRNAHESALQWIEHILDDPRRYG